MAGRAAFVEVSGFDLTEVGTECSTSLWIRGGFPRAFLVRQLPPWFENVGKRLVKAPKVYIRDSGILHALSGLKNLIQVQSNPKLGSSWEGFALEQVVRLSSAEREAYFYKTYAGMEVIPLADCPGALKEAGLR